MTSEKPLNELDCLLLQTGVRTRPRRVATKELVKVLPSPQPKNESVGVKLPKISNPL